MTASGAEKDGGLSTFARKAIEKLDLAPHPEGGWYRRTWQSATAAPATDGGGAPAEPMGEDSAGARPLASLIYFLLPAKDASAWHKVDADEVWLWHGPGSVVLELGGTGAEPVAGPRQTLGPDAQGVPVGQLVVPAGMWQRTIPGTEDALCSCVVSPGFTYAGFSLAE